MGWHDRKVRTVRDLPAAGYRIFLEREVRRIACQACGAVKRERLDFLADNPRFTKRFAFYVGRRCRQAAIRDVADELRLTWDTAKTLEMQYMQAQIARAGTPAPRAIGIDEISVRKGHTYRIVVSDLVRKRPIWFGGEDRSEASMAQFYTWLGEKKCNKIGLVVMDMWKPFRNVAAQRVPQAAILFDKFHIMRHLGEALDRVRKAEYARLSGKNRRFIKGQKYTLLSRRENLTLEGKRSLALLLAANKRLNTAYVLKESFSQLWDYERVGLGATLLRQLACQPQMAAPQTLRDLCRDDRSALGGHSRLLPAAEQGFAGFRRGFEQQNPRVSTSRLWAERRRISPPQGSLLHASAALTPENHPLDSRKTPK
jgi:transposase